MISKFQCPTGAFKLIDPKEFDSNKFSSNGSKGCVLEVDLEYPKELRKLYNDCSIAPYKIEIKKEMFSKYQLMIADFYNIFIKNFKILLLIFLLSDKGKYVLHYENLQFYLQLGLKLNKNTLCSRIQLITIDKNKFLI